MTCKTSSFWPVTKDTAWVTVKGVLAKLLRSDRPDGTAAYQTIEPSRDELAAFEFGRYDGKRELLRVMQKQVTRPAGSEA